MSQRKEVLPYYFELVQKTFCPKMCLPSLLVHSNRLPSLLCPHVWAIITYANISVKNRQDILVYWALANL